ncbi:MAG: glycosyltransferase [Gammaproteobacteria bacterium]|nr:glycosyltransferase [Gammaproteobacteria bacterium]
MQISVVIPSFNRIQTLVRAIESVLNQHSVVDEIIIVDDGSEDDTAALVSQDYPNIKLIRQTNQGVSAARNTGIRQARFEWIALLDSDDSWLPEKISGIRQAQQQYPEYRLFHSDEIWIRNGVRVNPMKKHGKNGGWIFESCLPLCVISPSAVVLQRSLLHTTGYFDESLPACEDYDLWLRICHAFPVHYIEHALIIKYGGHADQLSRRYWGMDRFRIRSLYALLQQQNLRQNYQSAVLSTLITKLEVLLKGAEKHDNQEVIAEFSPMLEQLQPPVRISECAAC